MDDEDYEAVLEAQIARRKFIERAVGGAVVLALGGGVWALSDDLTREARAQTRTDGRPRLPPGQRVLSSLRPMGGEEGDPSRTAWRLRVHGAVEEPYTLGFRELLAMEQADLAVDVHCVTGWSVLDARFRGVRIRDLAARAKPKKAARHVVLEAAHGYTTNVPLDEALAPRNLVAHRYDDKPLAVANGAPVRAVIPDLYFWKSAKWLTGIRFVTRDDPGYWEVRGYHNHGDPWREERYA